MDLKERRSTEAKRHPWEVARFRFFSRVLKDFDTGRGLTVLDVGAGDGWFSNQLAASRPDLSVTCWDAHYTHEVVEELGAAARGAVSFSMERPTRLFDRVLLLDVLEHVESDLDFLRSIMASNLAPGGRLLISVPTWPSLFSSHDTRLGHFRRYRPAQAMRVIEAAGLQPEISGGLFHSLILPRLAAKLLEQLVGPSDRDQSAWTGGSFVSQAVTTALAADNLASLSFARFRLSFPGLSWWCLCRKPSM